MKVFKILKKYPNYKYLCRSIIAIILRLDPLRQNQRQ